MAIIAKPTPDMPSAIGPYNPVVVVEKPGQVAFLSGQIGLDPATGELVEGLDAQVRQAMNNLGATLAAAGMGFEHVCRTTLYLLDMGDFQRVNAIYGQFFPAEAPARAAIGVAALPKGALFEVDAIAARA